MDYFKLLEILVAVVLSVPGLIIVHSFTSKRDIINKKREININLTIKSYESISRWMYNPVRDGELFDDLVNALILVQLFGSESQAEIAKRSLKSIADNPSSVAHLGDLFESLKKDFRSEIGLSNIEENIATIHNYRNR